MSAVEHDLSLVGDPSPRDIGASPETRVAVPGWIRACVAVAALSTVVHILFPSAVLGFDQMYALVWGRELSSGQLPVYDIPFAPTAHPLPVLVAALASIAGDVTAYDLVVMLAYASLGVLLYAVFQLGRLTWSWQVGVLAAVLIGTSLPILARALTGYLDIPFVALVVLAATLELRRPRSGVPVLLILALAGLLRPEAWALAAAYWLYLAPRLDTRGRIGAAVVALSAPLAWAFGDLVVTGSLLHATTDAQEAGRSFGVGAVSVVDRLTYGWDGLRNILRLPVLLGGLVGLVIAASVAWARAVLPAALLGLALFSFGGLVLLGLPTADRFLFLPAVMLALFCAFAMVGWVSHEPGRRRRWWAAVGMLILVSIVVSAPGQVSRLQELEDDVTAQRRISEDLWELTRSPVSADLLTACSPITLPTHAPQPALAYYLGRSPTHIRSAELGVPARGAFVAPASDRAADLALGTASGSAPPVAIPPGFRRTAGNASWSIHVRGCGGR